MKGDLLEKINNLENLPALPDIAKKVLDIVNKPDFAFPELVSVISKDMNITAEILRVANSALYSPKSEIKNLTQALSYLGAKNVKNIVIALSTKSLFEGFKKSLLIQKVWEHSVAVAIYSRVVAISLKNRISEEAFLIGMLHDLGILVMYKLIDDYEMMISDIYGSTESLEEKEKEIFGITHSQVGAKLAEAWNLPAIYADAILNHHSGLFYDVKDYSMIVEYADNVVTSKGINIVQYDNSELIVKLREQLGINDELNEEIESIFEEVFKTEKELMRLNG